MTAPPIKPYAHQRFSIKHNDTTPIVFDTSDAGTGKTYVRIAAFAKRRKAGGGCMLVVGPRSILRSVWEADIKKFAPHLKVSVASADRREKAFAADADVYIVNHDGVKWLAKQKKPFFAKFSELVMDECFPSGTMVDTPFGPTPINKIKKGDLVCTSAGSLPVTNTFVSQSHLLLRLDLENGTTFYCTADHPIATDQGWTPARATINMLAVQLDVHDDPLTWPALLLPGVLEDSRMGNNPCPGTSSPSTENGDISAGERTLEQGRSMPRIHETVDQTVPPGIRTSAKKTWWQRLRSTLRGDGARDVANYVDSSIPDHYDPKAEQRLPVPLQGGLRTREVETSLGDRRQFTRIAQALGCEEGRIAGLSRVVRVSVHESADPVVVFNLQVDGPHDYSVEGTLVHNCTAFKHHASDRSRAMLKIAQHFKYRAGLTATPNSNTILDVFHQALLLDGGQRLGKLYYQFRSTVATPVQTGASTKMIQWMDRDGAEDAVFGLLSDIVVRHKLDDCADIPPNHQYSIGYEMSTAQKKAYMEMETTQLLDLGKKGSITAIHAAAVATKLLQVASGAVYKGDGTYLVVDTSRYELILDLVEQRKHPLVLFQWHHQRDLLVAEATKRKLKFAVFDGGTSDTDRLLYVRKYQRGEYDVLFAHPKTVGHGQTLTAGTSTIWASPTFDLELMVQASSRQRRIGQTEKTETVVVIAEGTRDERVYEMMTTKGVRMANLLDLFSMNTPVAPKRKKEIA